MAVTITTGKTSTRYMRFIAEGNNLSGDSRAIGGLGFTNAQIDVTGWVDTMEHISGVKTMTLTPYTAMFNDAKSAPNVNAGTHEVLAGATTGVITVPIGINEPPTIGCPAFSGTVNQFSYLLTTSVGNAVEITADFQADVNPVAGWGPMLGVGTSTSANIDFGSIDNGAAAPNGYVWFIHVAQSVGAMGTNNWDLRIQHAPDDATWATAATQLGIGATVTSYTLTNTGSIDRYTRLSLTKTAGTDIVVWAHQIAL